MVARLRGDPMAGVTALSAFMGHVDPTDTQQEGALLVWLGIRDLHKLCRWAIGPLPQDIDP